MTTTKPRVYCASPYHRAKMWHNGILGDGVTVVSTWHFLGLNEVLVKPEHFAKHWLQDCKDIRQADVLLAYAEHMDKPQGTLIEIGYALSQEMPVHLVGNYQWSNWKHHPLVTQHETLREAIADIIGAPPEGIAEGDPL